MFSSPLASFALISTLVSSAVGAGNFKILSPGGDTLWWVAESQNTLVWSCHTDVPASTNNAFQLLLNNSSPTILSGAEAIVADVPNADCSHIITVQQANLPAGTGYTLVLADPIDQNKQYAVSQPFEIKALGAAYPPSSATPQESSSATQTGASNTGTGSGSSSSATSAPKQNGAFESFRVPSAGVLAVVGAAIGML